LEEEFNVNSSFEVFNSYDPHQPNDYIQYCAERLERKKQRLLNEERQRLGVKRKKKKLGSRLWLVEEQEDRLRE
jgi:hypothetical protein